jgi:AmiR/NasT family two-component response regulator
LTPAFGTGASQHRGKTHRAVLAGLHVIVVHPEDADGATLCRELRRQGCHTRSIWPAPQRLPDHINVLFCALERSVRQILDPVGGQPSYPVVGIVEGRDPELLSLMHDCAPLAVLYKPILPECVLPTLYLAQQIFQYQNRLLKRIGKLDETLKSMRNVERAKVILMKYKNLEEHEAYHFMRRQAMEKRVPIGTVASTIIDAKEILG